MSKTLGNVATPLEYADVYGAEALRYFLVREMNFGLDANFSEEAFVGRLNADLANDLGNFASRATTSAVEVRRHPGGRRAGDGRGPAGPCVRGRGQDNGRAQRWPISRSRRRSAGSGNSSAR